MITVMIDDLPTIRPDDCLVDGANCAKNCLRLWYHVYDHLARCSDPDEQHHMLCAVIALLISNVLDHGSKQRLEKLEPKQHEKIFLRRWVVGGVAERTAVALAIMSMAFKSEIRFVGHLH
jgi:hypothetical protein